MVSKKLPEMQILLIMSRFTYEGYGPSGVAIIVDTLTDNKNRTASNVNAFTKGNGNVNAPGCILYVREEKDRSSSLKKNEMDADDLMMMALDAPQKTSMNKDDSFEVLTTPEDFSAVREALEEGRNSYGRCQCHNDPWYCG